MINLKIKTLDSQDHDFSVNEEVTNHKHLQRKINLYDFFLIDHCSSV